MTNGATPDPNQRPRFPLAQPLPASQTDTIASGTLRTATGGEPFEFRVRTADGSVEIHESVAAAFGLTTLSRAVFINPHDDDAVFGAGLLIQAMRRSNVDVHIIIISDGRMGYNKPEHQSTIVDLRREETIAGYAALGVPAECIHRFDYPDLNLHNHSGRREASSDDPHAIKGYTGILNSLVHTLRLVQPDILFCNNPADTHMDHRAIIDDVRNARMFSSGTIWPELGAGAEKHAPLCWYKVYSPFDGNPNVRLKAEPDQLDLKVQSLEAWWGTQGNVGGLLDLIRQWGPVEDFQMEAPPIPAPSIYDFLFEGPKLQN